MRSQTTGEASLQNSDFTTPHYADVDTVVRSDIDNKPNDANFTTPHYGYYAKEQKNERGFKAFCNCGDRATIYNGDNAYCEACWNEWNKQ